MEIKVKGTSFANEDGESRQAIIKKVIKTYIDNNEINDDDLYDGNTNKDIKDYGINVSIYEGIDFPVKLKQGKFNNENCIEVYLIDYYKEKYKVGDIPKEVVQTIWDDVNENEEIPAKIVGGKYKEYDILEEKVITEDTGIYGIRINYITDEEKKETENIKKEMEQKRIVVEKENKAKQTKSIIVELIICIFLGIIGGHKFYKGNIKMGILYLFTSGLLGIGWIIDIIKLINNLINMEAQ